MIIWYSGNLSLSEVDRYETINPVILAGVDAASNVLYRVRINEIRDHVYRLYSGDPGKTLNEVLYGGDTDWRFAEGYREDGTARTLFNAAVGPRYGQEDGGVRAFAADTDGWLYCAMDRAHSSTRALKEGVTPSDFLVAWEALLGGAPIDLYEDYLESGYYEYFVDFFSIYRQNGDRITTPVLHERPVRAASVDASGCFYLAGEPDGDDYFLKKYNKDFSLEWAATLDGWWTLEPYYTYVWIPYVGWHTLYRVHCHEFHLLVDGDENVYVTGTALLRSYSSLQYYSETITTVGTFLRKYNSSGVLQWERRFALPYYYLILSNPVTDGTLIYVAQANLSPTVYYHYSTSYFIEDTEYFFNAEHSYIDVSIWDADGDLVDAFASPEDTVINAEYPGAAALHCGIRRLVYDDGSLYATCPVVSSYPIAYQFDTTTFAVSTPTPDTLIYKNSSAVKLGRMAASTPFLVMDTAHNKYLAGLVDTVSLYYLAAYDDAGDPLWSAVEPNISGSAHFRWMTLVEATNLPALALPVSLGTVSFIGDQYLEMPGLAFPISLAIPDWRREYVGAPLPDVYRLFLDGTPALEIKPSSLTIRRTLYGWQLTAVGCVLSVDDLTAITDRIGNTLTLYRGVRFSNGIEQLETMMEVDLETVRGDQGPRSFSCTVDGRTETAITGTGTRALRGISYRNISGNQRRLRCAIDPYLRPGDTATWGSDSLTVREITISISPVNGIMEITE